MALQASSAPLAIASATERLRSLRCRSCAEVGVASIKTRLAAEARSIGVRGMIVSPQLWLGILRIDRELACMVARDGRLDKRMSVGSNRHPFIHIERVVADPPPPARPRR